MKKNVRAEGFYEHCGWKKAEEDIKYKAEILRRDPDYEGRTITDTFEVTVSRYEKEIANCNSCRMM